MITAQVNSRLMEDLHEATYNDDSIAVFCDEARKFKAREDVARSVLRMYAARGIALHDGMTDDMFRSCFYEYAGAKYSVTSTQIQALRGMVQYK